MSQFVERVNLNYDALIDPGPDYVRECPMCLTNAQIQALLALIEGQELTWKWFSPTKQEIDRDLVEAFVADITWRLSDMACGGYFTSRIDDDGDWQISGDGGETWIDTDPGQDPRSATPIYNPLPGTPGEALRCEGANSIITRYKQVVQAIHDNLESGATEAAIAAILTGLLLVLGIITGGWAAVVLGPAIILIAFEISLETWDAAFSADFWQQLICILYEEMRADASYDRDGAAAVLGRIQTEMSDSIARRLTEMIVKVIWNIGLTNMARSGMGGEMDCDCGCDTADWEVDAGVGFGTITDRDTGWIQVASEQNGGSYVAAIRLKEGAARGCCVADHVEAITGGVNDFDYNYCEDGYQLPYAHQQGLFPETHEIISIAMAETSPFEIKIFFTVS